MKFVQPPLKYRMKIYYEELIEYKKLEGNRLALTTEEHKRHKFLREKLLRESQIFKDKIIELTNYHYIKIEGKTYDIWVEAFDDNFFSKSKWPSIDYCIDATNIAIGKLESIELKELGDKDSTDPHSVAYYLFDKFQFHPKVIEASRSLFKTKHYSQAIFEAFKAVNNFVKEKTGLELDGKALMTMVFKKENPIIKLNELRNQTEKDEQEGFMFLFMGAMVGIRNPKAHDNVIQADPYRTLEYLALASLLMKRAEEGELIKTIQPRKQWNLQKFLVDASEKCSHEVVDTINKLYDFTKKYSDSILWGTGAHWGSFTFRKSWHGIKASIFTVYSDSSLSVNFGQMLGKGIEEEVLESLRAELNRIPDINISRDAIPNGKNPDISVDPFVNAEHLNKFQEAVLSLCQNIESGSSK